MSYRQALDLFHPATFAFAVAYSRSASRATSSPAGTTAPTAPMPWPLPQMSRQALTRALAARGEAHLRGVAPREIVGIEPGVDDRSLEVIAEDSREQIGPQNVFGAALDDRLLVAFDGIGFLGGDEGRADIGEVEVSPSPEPPGSRRRWRGRPRARAVRRTTRGCPAEARTANASAGVTAGPRPPPRSARRRPSRSPCGRSGC